MNISGLAKLKGLRVVLLPVKNILIIGASSGIGKQLAIQLDKTQYNVFGTYNTSTPAPELQNVHFTPLDVLGEMPDFNYLPDTLHGMVYCPGSITLKPFSRISADDFVADYQLNVGGAVKVLQAVLPRLKKAESASIVFFSTVAVQVGLNFHSRVAASKGALEGLTRALAAELAPAMRVNCIAPSLTNTPLAASLLSTPEKSEANAQRHPLKKIGQPEDIADMAEFLLSDKSKWITGQILAVDGGMSAVKL